MASSEEPVQETIDDFRIHDEVRVATRLDGRSVSFRGTVIGLQALESWIGLTDVDERVASCVPGQPMSVATPRGTKALVIDTTFTRHIGPRRGRLFATTRPGDVRETQLRAYLRLEVAIAVEISASPRGRLLTGLGRTIDISAGGACFESRLPLLPGDRLTVKLQDAMFSASADAQVVRIDPPDAQLGRPIPWVAVRFVSILESDQDGITRYIHNEMRRRLKKGETGI